jgi:hypothetical protein
MPHLDPWAAVSGHPEQRLIIEADSLRYMGEDAQVSS